MEFGANILKSKKVPQTTSLELWAGLGIGGRVRIMRIFVRLPILKNILFWKKLLAWNERLNWNIATSKEFVSSLVFKLPTNYLTIILSETNHSLKSFNQLNHLKKKKGDTDFWIFLKEGLALPILGIIRLFNKIGK